MSMLLITLVLIILVALAVGGALVGLLFMRRG